MEKINKKELKELFKCLKNNENFDELYAKYSVLVYKIAFSILKNNADSEDVVQEVFTKLYSLDKDKLPVHKEASWLYTVTKNESLEVLRKKKSQVDLDCIYYIEDTDDEINKIIDQISYNKLLEKLNDKEKEIISLKILCNFSFKEIGRLLDEPTGTIKWRYYKIIKGLKIALSNFVVCILSFTVGIKALFYKDTSNKNEQEISKEENFVPNINDETTEKNNSTTSKDELLNNEQTESGIKQETIIEDNNTTNYLGIGILSFSLIFLIFAIIFLGFYIKYQLKLNKKSSK